MRTKWGGGGVLKQRPWSVILIRQPVAARHTPAGVMETDETKRDNRPENRQGEWAVRLTRFYFRPPVGTRGQAEDQDRSHGPVCSDSHGLSVLRLHQAKPITLRPAACSLQPPSLSKGGANGRGQMALPRSYDHLNSSYLTRFGQQGGHSACHRRFTPSSFLGRAPDPFTWPWRTD